MVAFIGCNIEIGLYDRIVKRFTSGLYFAATLSLIVCTIFYRRNHKILCRVGVQRYLFIFRSFFLWKIIVFNSFDSGSKNERIE